MSAIFGILRFDGGEVSPRDLERLGSTMAHRGPDGRKFVVEGPVGLGHCLTRVNREDLFEAQPLVDRETGVTLIADCRIDNREELAEVFRLSAADIRDMPDSAFVMRAYDKWGEAAAGHLLGDFAFAVWDGRAKKLVLARDPMGQRYVHFHHAKDFFAFATEIKALWSHAGVPRVLSEAQIGRLLMNARETHQGRTAFEDIFGLTGATILTLRPGAPARRRRYWEPHADPVHEGRDEAYYIAAYRRVLGEAVDCRIRRLLRPPGMLFSGGYDSAAIAGLAGPALAASGRKLVAAASVMPAEYRGTIRHARAWVAMCARDMPHLDVRYVTRAGKSVLTGLEQLFMATELPASPYHFVTSELLSTLRGAGVRLVMDGHGGDYTLNPRGRAALARFLATFQLRRFAAEMRGHLRLSRHSLWATLRGDIARPLLPGFAWALWRRARRGGVPVWSDRPIHPDFARDLVAAGAVDARDSTAMGRPKLDMRRQLTATLRRMIEAPAPGISLQAAQHGLELTRPFHDKRVVELALAVPQDLYVKDGRNRHLACAALKDVYPPEFQTRWRRNDDEIPDFQRMAKSVEPQLLAEIARMQQSASLRRYFDFEKLRRLLAARGVDDHNSGWEQETQIALRGFVAARYVEWFRPSNR